MSLPVPLSANYKGTFAYGTIKDRIPNILAKLVDACHKEVDVCQAANGEEGRKDALSVVGQLSQLRSEIMTNKPISLMCDQLPDVELWNKRFDSYRKEHSCEPAWFSAPWLYVECFMYRKVRSIISNSKHMNTFDPFMKQKQESLDQSMDSVRSLSAYLQQSEEKFSDDVQLKKLFEDFLQISLWGNKCDLSISGGEKTKQADLDAHQNLKALNRYLLVDDTKEVWRCLKEARNKTEKVSVDIVLDNAGFELVTDLVLAVFLLKSKLTDQVRLHPKIMPWFVSDVTEQDYNWTLSQLSKDTSEAVKKLCQSIQSYTKNGALTLEQKEQMTMFWSYPDPIFMMQEQAPALYNHLAKSNLVIFKGDLNYRKLVSDLDWPHETSFKRALRGFEPAPVCSLRTSKANVIVGLQPGQAEEAEKEDENWMVAGKYAVIQSTLS